MRLLRVCVRLRVRVGGDEVGCRRERMGVAKKGECVGREREGEKTKEGRHKKEGAQTRWGTRTQRASRSKAGAQSGITQHPCHVRADPTSTDVPRTDHGAMHEDTSWGGNTAQQRAQEGW